MIIDLRQQISIHDQVNMSSSRRFLFVYVLDCKREIRSFLHYQYQFIYYL